MNQQTPNAERIRKCKLERLDKFFLEMMQLAHEKQKEGDLWAATQIFDMLRKSVGEPQWTTTRETIQQRLITTLIITLLGFSLGVVTGIAIRWPF